MWLWPGEVGLCRGAGRGLRSWGEWGECRALLFDREMITWVIQNLAVPVCSPGPCWLRVLIQLVRGL